jgi:hypothetical protein
MKFIFVTLVSIIISCSAADAQFGDTLLRVKDQAAKMGQSLLIGDYKTFANYNNSRMLKLMGGEEKMTAALVKSIGDMKIKGIYIKSITFDEPSKIVKSGKELQSTIAQHTEVSTTQGRAVSTSTLIALSEDNGKTWTFLDTLNKDMATLKKIIPGLSSVIIIPASKPPVIYKF